MDNKTVMILRISFAVIGVFVGVSIFFSFGFGFNNWHCAGWGLASGVFAAVTLWVHLQFRKNELRQCSFVLQPLMYLGVVIQFIATGAFVLYIVIAALQKQKLTPYDTGFYVTAVWCFMTWKWAFLLFFFCRKYRMYLRKNTLTSPDTAYQQI